MHWSNPLLSLPTAGRHLNLRGRLNDLFHEKDGLGIDIFLDVRYPYSKEVRNNACKEDIKKPAYITKRGC